jgi:magnesium chelatase family protein
MAILLADGSFRAGKLAETVFLGELGLDGRLRPVPGVLPSIAAAVTAGFSRAVVPPENAAEAALVPGIQVVSAVSLATLLDWLKLTEAGVPAATAAMSTGVRVLEPGASRAVAESAATSAPGQARDLADVVGQPVARRAAEICAAGGHHMLLLGPPGVGKTMLAERVPTIMPALEWPAALEVSSVHSVAGTLPPDRPLMDVPPFCAPHHTATKAAIVGGGSGMIRPGAASLAHHGCLFLDEAPEFDRDVLDALRQPLESGRVVIARSAVPVPMTCQIAPARTRLRDAELAGSPRRVHR